MKAKRAQETKPAHRPVSKAYWLALIPVALAIIAYWNSFDVPMVFDDMVSIQKETGVRFGDILTGTWLNPRMLLYVTFTLNYLVHGQAVWGYHLINLLLHVLNGVLAFFIAHHIFKLTLKDERSARIYGVLAAACFVIHPIQTESVTYISSRSEVFSTFFYEAGFLTFIKWPWKRGFLCGLAVLALFLLAMGGKETTISLPLVILLYDWLFLSDVSFRPVIQRWRFYSLFVAGAAAVGTYVAINLLRGAIGAQPGSLSYLQYSLTQTRVVVRYIALTLFPINQHLDWDMPTSTTFREPAVILSSIVLAATIYLGWFFRHRNRVVSFCIFWFFITLSPTSSFMPILDVMFEHRLYLPMVGACLLLPIIAAGIAGLIERNFTFRLKDTVIASMIVGIFTVATIRRNEIWRSEVALWTDSVAKSPHKARPYNALSMSYFKLGEYDKAVQVNERAIQAIPESSSAFYETMGNMYLRLGIYDKAEDAFRRTAEMLKTGAAYNNLGVTYLYMWDRLRTQKPTIPPAEFDRRRVEVLTKAKAAFRTAIDKAPDEFWSLDSYVNVEFDLREQNALEQEAREKLQQGDALEPLYTVAKLLWLQNKFAEAVPYFDRAATLNVNDEKHKLFFFNYGYALDRIGQWDRAVVEYTKAVRLDPIFLEAYHNLGLVYYEKKDFAAARKNFADALLCDPNHVTAYKSHLYLGRIAIQLGELQTARTELKSVLQLSPNNSDAKQLLQQIGS